MVVDRRVVVMRSAWWWLGGVYVACVVVGWRVGWFFEDVCGGSRVCGLWWSWWGYKACGGGGEAWWQQRGKWRQ